MSNLARGARPRRVFYMVSTVVDRCIFYRCRLLSWMSVRQFRSRLGHVAGIPMILRRGIVKRLKQYGWDIQEAVASGSDDSRTPQDGVRGKEAFSNHSGCHVEQENVHGQVKRGGAPKSVDTKQGYFRAYSSFRLTWRFGGPWVPKLLTSAAKQDEFATRILHKWDTGHQNDSLANGTVNPK